MRWNERESRKGLGTEGEGGVEVGKGKHEVIYRMYRYRVVWSGNIMNGEPVVIWGIETVWWREKGDGAESQRIVSNAHDSDKAHNL
jgi:hypothetical protein